jgi:hypothetical protein
MIGIIAILISLIFLAFEIRQSNRIAISTVQYELSAQQNEFLRLIFENEEIAAFIARFGTDDDIDLTDTEIARVNAWVMHRLNVLASVDLAYQNGQFAEDNYRSYVAGYKSLLLRYPQLAPFHKQSIERIDPMGKRRIFQLLMDGI